MRFHALICTHNLFSHHPSISRPPLSFSPLHLLLFRYHCCFLSFRYFGMSVNLEPISLLFLCAHTHTNQHASVKSVRYKHVTCIKIFAIENIVFRLMVIISNVDNCIVNTNNNNSNDDDDDDNNNMNCGLDCTCAHARRKTEEVQISFNGKSA